MWTRNGMVGLIVFVALASATAWAAGGAVGRPEMREREGVQAVARGGNAFAVDLYSKLRGQEGNLFFSPYSISTALAMTYAGARGETATQMAETLHFDLRDAALHNAYAKLIAETEKATEAEGCELSVANALWAQQGYEFLRAFLRLVRESYDAPLHEVDFVGATEQARTRINDWVAERTRDKIQDLIPPGALDALTRLVLTNAVYFKGDWAHPFEEDDTTEERFWTSAEESVPAPMMHQAEDFGYRESESWQMVELPYAGETLSMVVVLPRQKDGLASLEKQLTAEKLAGWMRGLAERKVNLTLPKFKLTSRFELAAVLGGLGMRDAFSPRSADFSGMTGKRDLFVSAVIHKAYVDVNEEGTEAAAATGVVMKLTAVRPMEPVTFRADHPFLFLIRHRGTGSILFMGRVAEPEQADEEA